MTEQRTSTVDALRKDHVRTSVDFPVILGELVCTADRSWFGLVSNHSGHHVDLIPLDNPKKVPFGAELHFLGQRNLTSQGEPQYSVVMDPLGRRLGSFNPLRFGSGQGQPKSLWGLGKLEQFMALREGSGVVLVGDLAGGFAPLCARIAACQDSDEFFLVCQGGLRELQMICRALERAGKPRASVVWSAPWMKPALRTMVPDCLAQQLRGSQQGRALVLVDDLRLWLAGLLELGETSPELLMPNGYPHFTRQLFSQFLALPRRPDQGRSVSFLAGWHLDEEYPYIAEHPYGFQLLRFMETGIVLQEESERALPVLESWGELACSGLAWQALVQAASKRYDDGDLQVLEDLTKLFQELYLETPLWEAFPSPPSLALTGRDLERLEALLATSLAPLHQEVLQLRQAVRLCASEGSDAQRRCFVGWLEDRVEKGGPRP